jgi:hypothetical protein
MRFVMRLKLVGIGTLLGLVGLLLFALVPFAGANSTELFGHINGEGQIYKIDTSNGSGAALPMPTGNGPNASGMATSRGPVPAPGDVVYAAVTHFGLLADDVVVIDTVTGVATPVVTTSRAIGGRGIAFGPDGVTLYLIEGNAELSTIDTITGLVTKVGDVEDSDRDYPSVSLEFDPETDTFYAFSQNTVVNVDPSDGSATIVGSLGDLGFNPCTLARSPDGTWFTRQGAALVTIDIATGTLDSFIGGTGMTAVCGTAFAPERPLTIVVDIDIKPGSDPNSINCINENETIAIAILTSDSFDATTVDHTTVVFEGANERDLYT